MSPSATATSTRVVRNGSRRRPWWRGGSSVRRWNIDLLGWALLALGAGLLCGALLGGILGTAVLWVALLVPIVLAYWRGIPRGLLMFRPVDLLYGIVLGTSLRLAQGLLSEAFGGSGALPTYPSLDGALPAGWWLEHLLGGAIVAPVIEEFFFRGLVLIVIFTLVRRLAGSHAAAIGLGAVVGVVASTALFVLAHALTEALPAVGILSLTLVGLVCGTLIVTTGRIWPAVLVHVVYNGTGVLLAVVGTLLY